VLGAEDDGELIGFSLGFPARLADRWLLWSFATGVHPDYQGRGIGYRLKHAQRLWARQHGYERIGWTFDPLQRGNANFNFNKLGVVLRAYHQDFYGEMHDALNVGLASDRFEVAWATGPDSPAGEPVPPDDGATTPPPEPSFLLFHTPDEGLIQPAAVRFEIEEDADEVSVEPAIYAVEIPYDLQALKQQNLALAGRWQLAFRDIITRALAAAYTVTGFVVKPPRCWYILQQQPRQTDT
jgi:predicted GNAT superfamily acetyltransferase